MSKRKGMSAEEKRAVILKIYHEQMEPFNLKEVEAIASKRGVVLQTVKEQNQALVDDSLVNCDKIGSSNFFWSFPSAEMVKKKNRVDELNRLIESIESQISSQNETCEKLKTERKDPSRHEKLNRLQELRNSNASLQSELDKYKANDPAEFERIKKEVDVLKEGADRWTDNVWTIKSYLVKKRGMPGREVDKMLGINGDFDYLT